MKRLLCLLITAISLFVAPVVVLAAISLPESPITPDFLLNKYKIGKISVLVIPGHINSPNTGSQFRGIQERDLNQVAADNLVKYLREDGKFNVFTFEDVLPYFQYPEIIKSFRSQAYASGKALTSNGVIQKNQSVDHVRIPNDDTLILYGINKWAGDQNIDLVIHLHFNDYPRSYSGVAGRYSGFAIYIPEHQLANFKSSSAIAQKVAKQMGKYFPASNYQRENGGIVEDQDLIAVGAYSSFYGAAMLIEQSYLYEPQLVSDETQSLFLRDLAYQEYLGVKSFFDSESVISAKPVGLPHRWSLYLRKGFKNNADVYAMQLALREEGLYPPVNHSQNDCPINGTFGGCTRLALIEFQKKYSIEQTGFVGQTTLKKLNELYSK